MSVRKIEEALPVVGGHVAPAGVDVACHWPISQVASP